MYTYMIIELFGWALGIASVLLILFKMGFFSWANKKRKKFSKLTWMATGGIVLAIIINSFAMYPHPLNFAMPPMMKVDTPDGLAPSIPIPTAVKFLLSSSKFENVGEDIGADPNAVPAPITRTESTTVEIDLMAREVIGEVIDGVKFNYWTYNGTAPGPMLRVRQGDDVIVNLTNHESSLHEHNIDFHAVTGPGGGAAVTKVEPGETKSFKWKATTPGLFVYHCATANISTHNSHGQYGMIMVDPAEGLPEVDKEFYIMQGELYTQGGLGKKGLTLFDSQGLIDGNPTYVTFNGKVEDSPRMKAKVGDRIRMYVGNGGVNLISSFHVIGEIFDNVYPEAAIGAGSETHHNVQTTAVLPGGATIVEFTLEVPGSYTLVDHALARMNKGAWAVLEVEGDENPEIFQAL